MNPNTTTQTLTDLLRDAPAEGSDSRKHKPLLRKAALQVAAIGVLFGLWSALAPLAGAVVAQATVKVEHNRKAVQHQEGGIVSAILVRDGQVVKAGDPLLVVAGLGADADLAVLRGQWRAAQALAARADAESRGLVTLVFAPELASDTQATESMAREQSLFAARRRLLDEQVALLHAQGRDAGAQGQGLQAQIDATRRSAALTDEELALNETLAKDGYVARTRVIGLQRLASDYRSRLGEHASALAANQQRDGELRQRIAQLRLNYQAQGADELRDATARLREIEEKLRPLQDQAQRLTVRAPVDGVVMGLKVASVGTVIAPRELLLEVVPAAEKLVFDARVAPQDIEHVRPGGAAELRLLGSDAAARSPLAARVVFVAPDRVTEPGTDRTWFEVTLEADVAPAGAPALRPGMPAEAYIATGERSLLQYLLKPLNLFSQRAMREA
jgi:HlyD family type I secretion membrane fusion protein